MSIEDEIINYIKSNENVGAIMLTGSWGCGKTYLINDISSKLNKEQDYAIIVLSLFGIDSIDNIEKQIKKQIIDFKTNKKLSESKFNISNIKEIASNLSEYSKVIRGINAALSIDYYDFIEIKNSIKCYNSNGEIEKKLVLIFDDFERSKLDMVELLGVINNFSENKKIKVIVIADEEKIKEEYKEFKEKVIFNTYYLLPEYSKIISNIIENYVETKSGYTSFLNKYINLIEQVFFESNSNNIRILKAILINFERVYGLWCDNFSISEYIGDVLYTYAVMSFEYRKGNYKRQKYGYVFIDSNLSDKYLNYGRNGSCFNSLKQWVLENRWDENGVISEISRRYYPEEIPSYQKFLVSSFWQLNDQIILSSLPECVEYGYDGKLTIDELISLLGIISALKNNNISPEYKIDFKKLSLGLYKRKERIMAGDIIESQSHTFIENDTIKILGEDAINLNEQIINYRHKYKIWPIKKEVINDIKENLYYSVYGKCLESFDDDLFELFFDEYKVSDNGKRRELCLLLDKIQFDEDYYSQKEDIEITIKNFEKLVNVLNNLMNEESDKISSLITSQFISLLRNKIEKLKAK